MEISLRTLWSRWLPLRRRLDQLAWPLGLVGLAGVAVFNWRQWQRDKALLARVKEPPPLLPLEEWPALPLVSVLVAAWNEAGFVERHIESFLALRYPHKELVLCAGGNDGTYALARQVEGAAVKVLEQQAREGKQRALGRSLSCARGKVIFLTDADCLLNDDSFERTILPIVSGDEQATTGRFAPLTEQRANGFVVQQWFVDTYWRQRSPDYVDGLIGRNAAVKRLALVASSALDVPVRTGTDYYLARKLLEDGVQIRYVHDSMVQTVYVDSPRAYLRQQSRWLRNILLHGATFGAIELVRSTLLQCLSAVAFLLSMVLIIPFGLTGLMVWMLLLTHGTLSRLRFIGFGKRAQVQPVSRSTYLRAPLFFLLDQVMKVYTLAEWLAPQRRWQW